MARDRNPPESGSWESAVDWLASLGSLAEELAVCLAGPRSSGTQELRWFPCRYTSPLSVPWSQLHFQTCSSLVMTRGPPAAPGINPVSLAIPVEG